MKWSALAVAVAAFLSAAAPARASLTSSEAEQVRRGVATASDLPRVRALVARPDLSPDEAAAALVAPLSATPFDAQHMAFVRELVFGDSSEPARPVLAVAALRGVLARADTVLTQHGADLERAPGALAELALVYEFAERVAGAGPSANIPASARASCAKALGDHLTRGGTLLLPQSRAAPHVLQARAQAAIALLDAMPDAPTRRIDAAEKLALTGARRDLLVQRGTLLLDGGGDDAHAAMVRTLLDRFPALREGAPHEGVEAILVGGDASTLSARDGAVLAIGEDPGGAAGSTLLWGGDARPPAGALAGSPGEGFATSVARGLASAAVARAATRKEDLRVRIEADGGVPAVSAMAAMLVLNAPRALDVTVARLRAGHKESAACLADAIAALDLFALPSPDGPTFPVGSSKPTNPTAQLSRVALDPTGAASTFTVEGQRWHFERNPSGAVTKLARVP
jgi:hypothetical protein